MNSSATNHYAWSDSSDSSGLQYAWNELIESLDQYGAGGYHPTHLGDKFFEGRYEVIHKLGYGGYATVWLCRDLQEQRYVSVKIATSEISGAQKSNERKIYHALRIGNPQHPGKRFVRSLLNDFIHEGPNGRHQCFVFPVALDSVAIAKRASTNGSYMFPPQAARSIVMQSLLALSYIHSCGIVHAGMVLSLHTLQDGELTCF